MSDPSPPSTTSTTQPQFAPRSHNDVYPFIHPKKFKGALQDKVTIITGRNFFLSVQQYFNSCMWANIGR